MLTNKITVTVNMERIRVKGEESLTRGSEICRQKQILEPNMIIIQMIKHIIFLKIIMEVSRSNLTIIPVS